MTIDEAKNVIIEILRKGNGLTLLELYDEFIRNHGGKLKIENKSFEEILDIGNFNTPILCDNILALLILLLLNNIWS